MSVQRKQKALDRYRPNTLPRFQAENNIGNGTDLPDLARNKERKRAMIREMMKIDAENNSLSSKTMSPLKRIRETVQADLKAREKEMFSLDRTSLDTFALPGKPEPSSMMPNDNKRSSHTVARKTIRSAEATLETAPGNFTTKEFSFLPYALGSTTPDIETSNAIAEIGNSERRNDRPLSDLEEISEIMGRIHTGDDAINFFARFGSDTPVSDYTLKFSSYKNSNENISLFLMIE